MFAWEDVEIALERIKILSTKNKHKFSVTIKGRPLIVPPSSFNVQLAGMFVEKVTGQVGGYSVCLKIRDYQISNLYGKTNIRITGLTCEQTGTGDHWYLSGSFIEPEDV